jgi:hypothetical protein
MKVNHQKTIHRILSIFTVVAALIGSLQTIFRPDSSPMNSLLYFTIQSNLWIALIHTYFLIIEWMEETKDHYEIKNGMRTLKYVLTVSISITFIVFFILLVPDLGWAVVELPGSMPTHFWAPIAAIIDYIFFEREHRVHKNTLFYTVIPPLIYFIVTIILSLNGVTYLGNEPVPYFFLNFYEFGWFRIENGEIGVFYWVVIIAILILGIGYGLLKLNQWVRERVGQPVRVE